MPPSAIASSVFVAIPRSPRRSRKLEHRRRRNFGARPNPPHRGSNCSRSTRTASSSTSDVSGSFDARCSLCRAHGVDERLRLPRDVVTAFAVRIRDRDEHLPEARQTVPRLGRVVRAAEEGLARRREEDRHRPAALPAERDDRVHVDRVDVGTLLAVDLDADEALVHHLGRRRVLERLVLHHVAPVARRVADGEQDRLVLARALARAPRRPTGTSRRGCPRAGGGTGSSSCARRFTRLTVPLRPWRSGRSKAPASSTSRRRSPDRRARSCSRRSAPTSSRSSGRAATRHASGVPRCSSRRTPASGRSCST